MDKISIIIPVRDRIQHLNECLKSINVQKFNGQYEVIIVDDGSSKVLPEIIASQNNCKVIRQVPLGIAAARNRGIHESCGDLIFFIDSDCTLHANCLSNLYRAAMNNPASSGFQLKLTGNFKTFAGTMEHLRLSAIQNIKASSGQISYINTSGFAVRRSFIKEPDLFPLNVIRGEDTCVLAKLIGKGDLPVFVSDAIVKHSPACALTRYILKHFNIGYHSCAARLFLKESGNTILNFSDKITMYKEITGTAKNAKISFICVFLIFIAYIFECCGRLGFRLFGVKPKNVSVLSLDVEPVREHELISKALSHAQRKTGFLITYATAWSLVQGKNNYSFKTLLSEFDLVYADGMGVVLAALLTRLRFLRKVTLNQFYEKLFEEISNRNCSTAFIGGKPGVAKRVGEHFIKKYPHFQVTFCESGYLNEHEKAAAKNKLIRSQPDILFLGMGQPLQEELACSLRECLPHTVIWCVGDLFNTIIGITPKAPEYIRKIGMEWLHRLIHDPVRLWRRYVFGLPQLAYYIVKEIIRNIVQKTHSLFGRFTTSFAQDIPGKQD